MNKVYCQVDDCFADPLFEVFDGGDFVLSSYHDVEASGTEVRIFLPEGGDVDAAKACLSDALEVIGCSAPVEVAQVPDEDWRLSYRRHFKTEKVGRSLVTVPTWEFDDFMRSDDPDMRRRVPVVLDPGLAFGTGRHETTKACLQYIDELAPATNPESRTTNHEPRPSFLDMGCGSGILSIAARKLGYAPVRGVDYDAAAVRVSAENAALNGVPDVSFALCDVTADPIPGAEVVVANILAPILLAAAPRIARAVAPGPGAALVLSGILGEQYPRVRAAYEAFGFREEASLAIGEWTSGLLRRA